MRTLSIVAVLLLLAGCSTTVTNNNDFAEGVRTNPGNTDELADLPPEALDAVFKRLPPSEKMAEMSPEERGPMIEKAVADAKEAGEIPSASEESRSRGEVGGAQSGRGWSIVIINQTGEATQDVSAQVDAAVRAAMAANSPNTDQDLSGGEKPPEPKPDGE